MVATIPLIAQAMPVTSPWYVPFIPLFAALAGGGIAICAAFLSGWWQSALKERTDRLQKRKDKLERFVALAHELSVFPFYLTRDEQVFPQKLAWLNRIDELTTIALLHLPEMLPASSMISEASQELLEIAEQIIEESINEAPTRKSERVFNKRNARMDQAWERVMSDATELAERFRMLEIPKPLTSWKSEKLTANE